MRRLIQILGFVCLSSTNVFAGSMIVNSDIVNVTVYKKGALVERRARVKLPAGVTDVKIPFVSSELDQHSLQVGVSNLDVTMGSVKIDFEMPQRLALATAGDSLAKRLAVLNDSLGLLAEYSGVYELERSIVLKNDNIGGNNGFDAARLQGVAEFLRKDLNEIGDKQYAINKSTRDCNKEYRQVEQQVAVLNEQLTKPNGVIYISLMATTAAETEINIKYMVENAGWKPIYELRINPDQSSSVQMISKVLVSQKSQEDWNNVPLTVTLTNPTTNSTLPKLQPFTLPEESYNYKRSSAVENTMVKVMGVVRDEKKVLGGALVTCDQNKKTVQTDSTGYYELMAPTGANLKFHYSGYKEESRKVGKGNVKVLNMEFQRDGKKTYSKISGGEVKVTGLLRSRNLPLSGGEVFIKGTNEKTVTDANGYFTISVRPGQTLSFLAPGYANKELVVKSGQTNYNVILDEEHEEMEVTLSEDLKLRKAQRASVDNALQGRVAGVSMTSGTVGATSTVHIHGYSSVNGSAEPLYIVDGMPIGGGSSSGSLASIDPSDIVSMEVLKDASATSIYGSRASNGVIIITTRKGKNASFNGLAAKLQDYTASTKDNATVPADGTEHEAFLNEKQVPVTFTYYAVPKMSQAVYKQAIIKDWTKYEIQDGKTRVFMDNTYVGDTYMSQNKFCDTLWFSVAKADDVAIERKLVSSNQKGMLLNLKDKVRREWLIVIKNNKAEDVSLAVRDAYPVSTNKDIKVELLNDGGAYVNKESGFLSWQLNLKPGERKELRYVYEVTVKNTDEYDIEDFLEEEDEYEND